MALQLDDKRKKTVIVLAVILGLSLFLLFLVWMITSSNGQKEAASADSGNVISEVPDGEGTERVSSKETIYKSQRENSSAIEDYWAALEGRAVEEESVDDVFSDNTPSDKNAGQGAPSTQSYTTEGLLNSLGGSSSSGKSEAQLRYEDRVRRQAEAQAKADAEAERLRAELLARQGGVTVPGAAPEAAVPPASAPEEEDPDTITLERVQVRRTGSVSTLDDGFVSSSLAGISSLEAADDIYSAEEQYPFKCMFTRDEKIKTGDRVSVRLLEDMVIDGQLVPKNTHLQATCSIGKRLDLNVSSLDIGGKLISFDYDAYDNDGAKGLYFPDTGNSVGDQARNLASEAVMSRASSGAGRVAQDVIQLGRVVVNGKGKDMSVSVPAGYQFYLVKKVR